MTEQEYDAMYDRLATARDIKNRIDHLRAFLSGRPDENASAEVRELRETEYDITARANGGRTVLRLPMIHLRPVLCSYAEKRIEELIKQLESL